MIQQRPIPANSTADLFVVGMFCIDSSIPSNAYQIILEVHLGANTFIPISEPETSPRIAGLPKMEGFLNLIAGYFGG